MIKCNMTGATQYSMEMMKLLLNYEDTMELRFSYFILTFLLCLFQVCRSAGSPEGVVSLSGVVEFIPDEAAHSASYVLHQEPGPIRGRHAHTEGETHRTWLELLRLLHGPGTSLLCLLMFKMTSM